MNKHTPPPWIARKLSEGIWTVEATSPHVPGKTQEVCRISGPWNPENYRRNANLISAAPELLEALEACLPYVIEEYNACLDLRDAEGDEAASKIKVLIEKAEAAISKAKVER